MIGIGTLITKQGKKCDRLSLGESLPPVRLRAKSRRSRSMREL